MNILLQNRRTLNFLGSTTGWTPNNAKARIFRTGLEAMSFCLTHHVADMQILDSRHEPTLDSRVSNLNRPGGYGNSRLKNDKHMFRKLIWRFTAVEKDGANLVGGAMG